MILQDYTYSYHPGTNNQTVLLLHGVGGNEHDMDQVGKLLVPESAWISPKGPVSVDGHARYFTRRDDASFDPIEVATQTDNLARFIAEAQTNHQLDDTQLIAIGYSNGANMIASLLARHPSVIKKAVLFRGMLPVEFPEHSNLNDVDVLLLNGEGDHIMDKTRVQQLRDYLEKCGADVTLNWTKAGHQLAPEDISIAAQWLAAKA